ncbi:hypothetical protein [Limnobacter sp.]|uniref:hypothetical protein n=1 Tax=Limnobacter sp. TaxID=2003368 RepID=UPI0035120B12
MNANLNMDPMQQRCDAVLGVLSKHVELTEVEKNHGLGPQRVLVEVYRVVDQVMSARSAVTSALLNGDYEYAGWHFLRFYKSCERLSMPVLSQYFWDCALACREQNKQIANISWREAQRCVGNISLQLGYGVLPADVQTMAAA